MIIQVSEPLPRVTPISSRGASSKHRPLLPGLDGLRISAAIAIYLFHVVQAHDAGLMRFPVLDAIPESIHRILGSGYIATGLFFVLSGFLLTYVYLDDQGSLKGSSTKFWIGRFVRLYPLYFISLLLLAPLPSVMPMIAKKQSLLDVLGGMSTSLTLIQAWFPKFALWWNAPAWALSAMATFYFVFPRASKWCSSGTRRLIIRRACILSGLSVLPATLYLVINPEGNAWTAVPTTLGGFWLTVVRFHPLSWLPQFLMGICLGRLHTLSLIEQRSRADDPFFEQKETSNAWFARSDFGILLLALILGSGDWIPYVLLRHGICVPIYILLVFDVANRRGLVGRLFAHRWLREFSIASFPLFALQMPVGVWFAFIVIGRSTGSVWDLLAMVTVTLATSYVAGRLLEQYVTRHLKQWINPR